MSGNSCMFCHDKGIYQSMIDGTITTCIACKNGGDMLKQIWATPGYHCSDPCFVFAEFPDEPTQMYADRDGIGKAAFVYYWFVACGATYAMAERYDQKGDPEETFLCTHERVRSFLIRDDAVEV